MVINRPLIHAVALLAGALVIAACNSDGRNRTGNETGSSGLLAPDAVFQPSDAKGGTLRVLATSDCDYWDPQRTYFISCWNMQRLINRTLMMYAVLPGEQGLSVVPDLAAAMPVVTDGGRTWRYTLRDGLKFEDGTPITTKDVKYGIERAFATDVINGGPTYVVDELRGGSSYKGPYRDKAGLASIETPDAKTIVFHLRRPFSDWNFVMAMSTSTPVPQAKDTGAKYTFHPVASGPYKISAYKPNQSMTLVRNPEWSHDPNRPALPDRVQLTMGLKANDIDQRIVADQADVSMDGSGVQQATVARIQATRTLNTRSTSPLTGSVDYLTVFQKNTPFNNQHCRNAIVWAVNKKAQQLASGGPLGGGDIATTMTPPTLQYFEKFDFFPTPGGQGSIAKAKQELARCGYPKGFKTKIVARTQTTEVKQAEALQADLKRVGIDASVATFDAAQYVSGHIGIPAIVRREKLGIAFTGWGPDWPSPYGFFHFIVDGREILPQGNLNSGELNDPVVNTGIDRASTDTSEAARQKNWSNVDRAVVRSAVYIPLLYGKSLNIVSTATTNAYIAAAFGMYDYVALGVKGN